MKFKEIELGQTASLTHVILKNDIDRFVDLTGDDNKLHVDKDFASSTSFKKPVVHGMLGASFISTVIGTKLPGDGALWFSQSLEFLLPVRIGDEITVLAEVIKKHEREQIIELDIKITNQNRQVVTRGVSKVKLVEISEEEYPGVSDKNKQRSKTVLVLGGSGGIGSAVCEKLAEIGLNVIIHYNSNAERAKSLEKRIIDRGGKATSIRANISDEQDLINLTSLAERKFTSIDAFVNCAATPIPPVKFMDLGWSDFEDQLHLNLRSNLILAKALVPKMIEKGYGKFVFIGTIYADRPNVNLSHYISGKSALFGFMKSMALELAPKGINVNMVSPSVLSTELTADIPEKVKLMSAAQTPLRRLAQATDVAASVAYLISEGGDYLAGENIRINGGQSMI